MELENKVGDLSPEAMREGYTTSFITSKDGATIGYRQYGHGPGLVLVQGAVGSAHNLHRLAVALAGTFTVYVPDRRGRGLSSLPYSKDYSIQKDVDDLDALLARTGAGYVFGLTSGGLITLQAALTLPAIHKAAIFEPPLFINENDAPAALIARYRREIAQGKVAAALITGMKAAQMGPPSFNVIPRFLLELLVSMAMKREERKGSNGYISMRELAPTLQYDFSVVAETSGQLERFRVLRTEILLLGGSTSPAYLKAALDALEKVLPRVNRREFAGLGHGAPWNTDRGGRPEPVAQELRRFFAKHTCEGR